jgi:hypothetical protein
MTNIIINSDNHQYSPFITPITLNNKTNRLEAKMMGNMMSVCVADTDMCKIMVGKTMDLCEMDKSKCKMMMSSIKEHPKSM